jgi:hypothetical protein
MWSFSGPHPRPSLISMVIDRLTTSREARSLAVGAYLEGNGDGMEHMTTINGSVRSRCSHITALASAFSELSCDV